MKRIKESGSAYRKKKKAREEDMKKHFGSMVRHLVPRNIDGSASVVNVEETLIEDEIGVHETYTSNSNEEKCSTLKINTNSSIQSETKQSEVGEEHIDEETPTIIENNLGIDLKDVGCWPETINKEVRIFLVKQGSLAIQNLYSDFHDVSREGENVKGQNRHLTRNWFYKRMPNNENILRSWLLYSPSKKALFCFCCRLFSSPCTNGSAFATIGFTSWWKLNPKLPEHESSKCHIDNFVKWKDLEIRLCLGKTIDMAEQEQILSETKKWKEVLKRLLDVIKFLVKQNLAFRGHRENFVSTNTNEMLDLHEDGNKGNFLELVFLLSKYDPVLKEHVIRLQSSTKISTSYLSPRTQNEFIEILGNHVRSKILERVKKAKYFSIILDSTPDISHIDQTSQIIRYVYINDSVVSVEESFIDFIEIEGKTGASISKTILEKLELDGLDIQDCRGQAYDNASSMSGKFNGVQQLIKNINKKAEFVACTNHSLNLAGLHAASSAINSVTFFGTVDRLYNFFSSSTHRWSKLVEKTNLSIKRAVETRWSTRKEAVTVIKDNFLDILEVLEALTNPDENHNTRSDSGVLLIALQSFAFLSFLNLWQWVLTEIDETQKYLQIKGLNLKQCSLKLSALQNVLVSKREIITDESLSYAKDICNTLDIQIERRSRIKKKMAGETAEDAALSYENELRREMLISMDRIIQEITERFHQLQNISKKYDFLTPLNLLNKEYNCIISSDIDELDREAFILERERLSSYFLASKETNNEDGVKVIAKNEPLELLQFIIKYQLESSVPNIVIALRIFLTIAISVATCERSFSKLKLIKNYLRSKMTSLRLSNLAILSIERKMVDEIDFDDIINTFADKKKSKNKFLKKY